MQADALGTDSAPLSLAALAIAVGFALRQPLGHALRKEERMSDTFAVFTRKLLRVSKRYPNAAALIPSMQKRLQGVLLCKGGMTKF